VFRRFCWGTAADDFGDVTALFWASTAGVETAANSVSEGACDVAGVSGSDGAASVEASECGSSIDCVGVGKLSDAWVAFAVTICWTTFGVLEDSSDVLSGIARAAWGARRARLRRRRAADALGNVAWLSPGGKYQGSYRKLVLGRSTPTWLLTYRSCIFPRRSVF
jgi:hypothetical protein